MLNIGKVYIDVHCSILSTFLEVEFFDTKNLGQISMHFDLILTFKIRDTIVILFSILGH